MELEEIRGRTSDGTFRGSLAAATQRARLLLAGRRPDRLRDTRRQLATQVLLCRVSAEGLSRAREPLREAARFRYPPGVLDPLHTVDRRLWRIQQLERRLLIRLMEVDFAASRRGVEVDRRPYPPEE